jgi:alpha-glucosidase
MEDPYLWWRDGVIYQIYPRSFMDTNGDGIGDLNGITSKLGYLNTLGIDAIWLSPIYPSPNVDFGYDVSDYTGIHPQFGSMSDFERLVDEAHRLKIHVILDLVLNHTSNQHSWFIQSCQSKNNTYRDWYLWRNQPNNWQSVFGGKGWELDSASGEYYFHMFYKEQPDVNWRNPELKKAMLEVLRFWLDKGVDGFRLDVFNAYFKRSDFMDNPPKFGIRGFDRQEHINDIDQPEMMPLLGEFRSLLDAYSERYMVGETFLNGAEKAATYCGSDKLHAAFNFEFLRSRWHPKEFLNTIQRWENILPPEVNPNYVLNNHDVPRSATRYGRGENDERLKILAALLLTQRGTPFIYYGEEIGMRNVRVTRHQIQDSVGKRFWPFYSGRDGCRSPMQWNASKNAGFSQGKPWLPLHSNYMERNVLTQKEDPDSLYCFYRQLIQLRRQEKALRQGIFLALTYEPRFILAYMRKLEGETILIVMNFGWRQMRFFLGSELNRAHWRVLLSNKSFELTEDHSGQLLLKPEQVVILKQAE